MDWAEGCVGEYLRHMRYFFSECTQNILPFTPSQDGP